MVGVGVAVIVGGGVMVGLGVIVGVGVTVIVGVGVTVLVGDGVTVIVGVGVTVTVGATVTVGDGVIVGVGVTVIVGDGVIVGEGETGTSDGIRTVSMPWIMPFDAITSGTTIVASLTIIMPLFSVIWSISPSSDVSMVTLFSMAVVYALLTTWYRSTFVRVSVSFRRLSRVLCPSLSKASSVGAKRVNGPVAISSSVRSAASRAVNSVPKRPSAVNTLTISPAGDVEVGVPVVLSVGVDAPDWELAFKAV
jgi:hypothetical protein